MKWNKLNYEVGYLDYLEGNMSEKDRVDFEYFLESHPELKTDLDLDFSFQKSTLVTFEKKEQLYKKTWGDLPINAQEELKEHLIAGKTTPMEEVYLKRWGFKEFNQKYLKNGVAAALILSLGFYFAKDTWYFGTADFVQIKSQQEELNPNQPQVIESTKSTEVQTLVQIDVLSSNNSEKQVKSNSTNKKVDKMVESTTVLSSNESQKTESNDADLMLAQNSSPNPESIVIKETSDAITAHINDNEDDNQVLAANNETKKPGLLKKTLSIFSKKKLSVEVKDGAEDERYINVASSNFNYHRKIKK